MSVEVVNPFDSYRANSGVPLDAGKLYVGVANLDPQTNPIEVFYDPDLTIAAPQPLVTSGGYVWRSGAPARIYVAERQFSMRLLTQNNQQIFYSASYSAQGDVLDAVAALNTDLTTRYLAADAVLDQKIALEAATRAAVDAAEAATRAAVDAAEATARAAQDTILMDLINALANGSTKAYLTYAALNAAKASLPVNSFARVTNDPTPANNWLWQWNGTVLTKSARDDLAQANAYADANPFFKTQILAAGANLDTLPSGNYIIPSDSVAETMTGLPPAFAVPRRGYVFVMREGTTNYQKITKDFSRTAASYERTGNGRTAVEADFEWYNWTYADVASAENALKAYVDANPLFKNPTLNGTENLDLLPSGKYFISSLPVALALDAQLPPNASSPKAGWIEKTQGVAGLTELVFTRYTKSTKGEYEVFKKTSNGGSGALVWLDWEKNPSRLEIDRLPTINCFKDTRFSGTGAVTYQATQTIDSLGVGVANMLTTGVTAMFYEYDVDNRIFVAGQPVTFSAEAMSDATGLNDGCDISIVAYKTDVVTTGVTKTTANTQIGVWEELSVTHTLPADAIKFRVRFIRRANNTYVKFKKPVLTSSAWDATFISAFGTTGNATPTTIYVAKTGNNANTGTKLLPKLTVQAAINTVIATGNNGCVTLMDSEWYRESVVNNSDLTIELNAVRGKRGTIIGSDRLIATKTSGFTKIYQAALAAKPVGMGGARGAPMIFEWGTPSSAVLDEDVHSLQRGEAYRLPYTVMLEAASKAELDTVGGNGKWWWESGIIYFAATDGSDATLKQYEARVRPCFAHTGGAMVLRRIDSYFSNYYGMSFGGASVVRDDCRAYGAYHNGFSDNANSTMSRRDMSVQNGNDGFNGTVSSYEGTPNMDTAINASYFDPYGSLNGDDGISFHIRGTCNIWGGLFEYNTKAGVVHVTGGGGNCYGTIARGQVDGFYTATAAPDGRNKSSMHCHNTIAEKNTYDYRAGDDSNLVCINTMSTNPSGFGYYQTGTGKIVARNCKYTGDPAKAKSGNVVVTNDSVLT